MRKGIDSQQPPKSNFWFILMMTFLFLWTIQAFKKPEEPTAPVNFDERVPSAAPKLTENEVEALPQEFRDAAERERTEEAPQYITLGSLDPESPYKMLATLTNRGAAVVRVELNEEAYQDNSDKTGYLGQIVADEYYAALEKRCGLPGVLAQVVGSGSPAEKGGLAVGDRIVGFADAKGNRVDVDSFDDLRAALLKTKPGDKIKLEIYEVARLGKSAKYAAARLVLAKYMASPHKTAEPLNEAEGVVASETPEGSETPNTDASNTDASDADVVSNELSAPEEEAAAVAAATTASEDSDRGSVLDDLKTLGAPKVLEIDLTSAPLSVVRPSGMTLDYSDYVDLAGLQGLDYRNNDELELLNYDPSEEHVRKHNSDPASFLTTICEVDADQIQQWTPPQEANRREASMNKARSLALDSELGGVDMRDGYWRYVPEESSESVAVFKKALLERRLEVVKRYELVKTDATRGESDSDAFVKNGRAYHMKLSMTVRNYDANSPRTISYLLDGPTGLPLEGAWFSSGRKTGPGWGAYGLRDVVVSTNDRRNFDVVKCIDIAQDKTRASDRQKLDFIGVDGQYFQCTAMPTQAGGDDRFVYSPIRVGARYSQHINFTDVSFRLKSDENQLAPYGSKGDSFTQEFVVFIGPKQRDVMADYGLSKTIVYGWFWFVSIPLLWILHFFHDYLVFNYGIAIIMLTILVRLCLFPLSRKQVTSSIRMQKLQPELAKLKEKYKDNPQEMMVAQQALFKKHGVNPLSGCLPIFIQMPIFIGLYKALSLDVNLYGAPLFSKSVRWCSNLAAPDMAINWSGLWNSIGWPSFNMSGGGFFSLFALGPYLNVLPIVTVALFLVQQKFLAPPPVGDDAQAQQQRSMRRMMNFMMIFMGFMFFKVPSGLCVYFIVSSLWGLMERKMLPKRDVELATTDDGAIEAAVAASRKTSADRAATLNRPNPNRRGKTRRSTVDENGRPKSKLRLWWEETLERAQEQQRLAKAEEQNRPIWGGSKKDKKRRK